MALTTWRPSPLYVGAAGDARQGTDLLAEVVTEPAGHKRDRVARRMRQPTTGTSGAPTAAAFNFGVRAFVEDCGSDPATLVPALAGQLLALHRGARVRAAFAPGSSPGNGASRSGRGTGRRIAEDVRSVGFDDLDRTYAVASMDRSVMGVGGLASEFVPDKTGPGPATVGAISI